MSARPLLLVLALLTLLAAGPQAAAAATAPSHVSSTSFGLYGASDAQAVTVPSVADGLLLFAFAGKRGADSLTSVTYGGRPLQLLAGRSAGSVRVELWYLLAPPAGTAPLRWQKSGGPENVVWGASVYSGVHQTAPFGPVASSGFAQVTFEPFADLTFARQTRGGDGRLAVDAVAINGSAAVGPPAAGNPAQTVAWARGMSTTQGGSSSVPVGLADGVTMLWHTSSTGALDWASLAVALNPAVLDAPLDVVPVSVAGPVPAGAGSNTLTAVDGWLGTGSLAFAYRWLACAPDEPESACSPIDGANGRTEVVGSSGCYRVAVTATDATGSTTATGSYFISGTSPAAVSDLFCVLPRVTNDALPVVTGDPREGQPLSADVGDWLGLSAISVAAAGFDAQWQRCDSLGGGCVDIPGTASHLFFGEHATYTPTAFDVGSTLRVRVTATNDVWTQHVTVDSLPTGIVQPAVAAVNLAPDPDLEASPFAFYSTVGPGAFAWATDAAHSPDHALRIVSTVDALSRWIGQVGAIRVEPGALYTASAWLRTHAVGGHAELSVNFWDAAGRYIPATVDSARLAGTHDWTQLTVRAAAPAGAASVRIEIRLTGSGTVWADDLAVSR
jgi:hypothetical protein